MTQSGRQQFDFILEYRKQVFLKTGLGWFEDQVACGSGTTKEEDGFRREVVNSSCHSHSQVFTGDFKHFKCDLVALDSCIIDYLGCKILERIVGQDTIYTIVFCKQFECSSLHSRSRAIGLKVTKGSTSAKASTGDKCGMAAFTCKTVMTVNQVTVYNNTTTHACSEGVHNKVPHPLCSTVDHLTYGSRIGIICQSDILVLGKFLFEQVYYVDYSSE